jgi:uncharacterized glyoxalase superfamily protein PhnB
MLKLAIPILNVSDSETARRFYTEALGFELASAYRPDRSRADPCFMVFRRDEAVLHVSSFPGDGVPGQAVNINTDPGGVDALYAELQARGVAVELAPTDQDWGDREMYVSDGQGNSLRFQHRFR